MNDTAVPRPRPVLRLYVRLDCGACERMKQELFELKDRWGFDFEIHDIDALQGEIRRLSDWVPVLMWGRDIICCHKLDRVRLAKALGVAPDA
ncbi:MAG: hypothetical protein KatS3mg121_0834 [Gammaproteobacteria bacterium]|nr:MAG: hypothetical protein KatS3mg121_0834 [Gammaproteobacteria bacterium]